MSVINMISGAEVEVFISNYTLVDPEVYQLWVDGCSSAEAGTVLYEQNAAHQPGTTLELVASDVLDHYRTYSLLERLLHNPPKLSEQLSFQIEPQTKQLLIEKYYEFDDVVIREFIGKKLSSRHRKDLDEVSEKTNVSLKSCRRQFDNVKRVFKTVEEIQGSVVQNIRNLFLLPDELAKRYAVIVFMSCIRFETGKRKLNHLTFSDFYHCATAIMQSWTYRENTIDYDDTEIDKEFLSDLRELKSLVEKEKELKHLVCQRLKPKVLERTFVELESNFRTYSRAIVYIGANLNHTRELRSLFVDLIERFIEPWRQSGLTQSDLNAFLSAYTSCALEMDALKDTESKMAFDRYMSVISSCLLKIFHS
ncbi:hypothetical protein LSTR_LSTR007581 [Laodelphax striatellus]|uniref:Acidic fibroblast growth factor intracellular-binding protein n=1 Tax=Laodelphax striatellus TaxID=195883 RepID=A0A482XRV1_LAOST|nr:hypothetical protein LSTR_LSTR007581 [Laodelphax striatellus]